MMQLIYSLITLVFSPIVGLAFLVSRKGRQRIWQRFGLWGQLDKNAEWLWFHGASLGEVSALEGVVEKLRSEQCKKEGEQAASKKILISVTSPAALERASQFADAAKILPFDVSLYYWLAVKNLNIKNVVFTETEIWPGLINYLSERKIQISWINARMMEASFRWYRVLSVFFKPLFLKINAIAAQTETDAERFRMCGALSVEVLGNTKYDIDTIETKHNFALPQEADFIVSVTNIRPEEEKLVFPVLSSIESKSLIFIIPRHKEAFSYFYKALSQYKIPFVSIADYEKASTKTGVVLVDRFGMLETLVSKSHAVIAAGSFCPQFKGHNLLVAAEYSIPVCTGPYNESSQPVLQELSAIGGIMIAESESDIRQFIDQCISKSPVLREVGKRSREYLDIHKGSTARVASWLDRAIDSKTVTSKPWLLQCLLSLPAMLFGLLTVLRNKFFDYGVFSSYHSSKLVISVGNISVGGTGKTPLVIKLVNELSSKGYRCAVVSRGYKGSEKGPFVVSASNRDGLIAARVGDEPLEISYATSCPVVIAKKRVEGVKLIEKDNLADIIVLDDGFQHRWVHRDYNIVCVDISSRQSVTDFAEEKLLPAGIFRESVKGAKKRIDRMVFSTRQTQGNAMLPLWAESIKRSFPQTHTNIAYYSSPQLIDVYGKALDLVTASGKKAFVFCAIGNPEGFLKTIAALNLKISNPALIAPDHHFFSESELQAIEKASSENDFVITTGKDFRRLPKTLQEKVFWLKVDIVIEPDLIAALPLGEQRASAS